MVQSQATVQSELLDRGTTVAIAPPQPAERKEALSLLEMIERASRDPAVDINKFERLLVLKRQLEADEAKNIYFRQLKVMKPKLPVIDRNGRIEVREKTNTGKRDGEIQQSTAYARWEDIDEAITPILDEHGFVVSYRTGDTPDGKVKVTTICTHEAGHQEETTITLQMDTTGSKNNVQAVGSSLSYGKRYGVTFLLNIRTKGQDDDGKKSADGNPIGEEVMGQLSQMCEQADKRVDAFCKWLGVDALKDITVGPQLNKAREMLNHAISAKQRKDKAANK